MLQIEYMLQGWCVGAAAGEKVFEEAACDTTCISGGGCLPPHSMGDELRSQSNGAGVSFHFLLSS